MRVIDAKAHPIAPDPAAYPPASMASWEGRPPSSWERLIELMDEAARSSFKRSNVLRLPPYTAPQLMDILSERVRLGFHKGTVAPDAVELIADIAAEEGDARYAIELLEHAGRLVRYRVDTRAVPPIGEPMRPARVYDSNGQALADAVRHLGCHAVAVDLPVAQGVAVEDRAWAEPFGLGDTDIVLADHFEHRHPLPGSIARRCRNQLSDHAGIVSPHEQVTNAHAFETELRRIVTYERSVPLQLAVHPGTNQPAVDSGKVPVERG